MLKKKLGWSIPIGVTSVTLIAALGFIESPSVKGGIVAGILMALAQSFSSTASLQWAWKKTFFYWIWGGGILARLLILAATAYVVYRHTSLNLVATLVTMVSATTLFLVVELMAFFN